MIEFENVTRSYGRKVAVAGLSLVVPAGQVFAFLGPNGAGKTTAIKMLVGLLRPSSGRVRLGGYDLTTDGRRACRLLGYVPDVPFLYDKLTGREFLHFIAGMHGLDERAAAERVHREMAHFELEEFIDELAETYSHGMKQRLVFAASMLHDPAVLVIDEPLVGLDPRSARRVKNLLRERANQGAAIFMSTHLLDVAEEIADRIGIVDRGRLLCVGTMEELQQTLSQRRSSLEQVFLEVTAASGGSSAPGEALERNGTE
jgi:ABC-2 type transport system ATP-binding protein